MLRSLWETTPQNMKEKKKKNEKEKLEEFKCH